MIEGLQSAPDGGRRGRAGTPHRRADPGEHSGRQTQRALVPLEHHEGHRELTALPPAHPAGVRGDPAHHQHRREATGRARRQAPATPTLQQPAEPYAGRGAGRRRARLPCRGGSSRSQRTGWNGLVGCDEHRGQLAHRLSPLRVSSLRTPRAAPTDFGRSLHPRRMHRSRLLERLLCDRSASVSRRTADARDCALSGGDP